MSIRIHELAKRHNMEGKDMLALLKARGYVAADTKSVSSTLSKIYKEEIEKEFAAKAAKAAAEAAAVPPSRRPRRSRPGRRSSASCGIRPASSSRRPTTLPASTRQPRRPRRRPRRPSPRRARFRPLPVPS